jgi:hypothetical protein
VCAFAAPAFSLARTLRDVMRSEVRADPLRVWFVTSTERAALARAYASRN